VIKTTERGQQEAHEGELFCWFETVQREKAENCDCWSVGMVTVAGMATYPMTFMSGHQSQVAVLWTYTKTNKDKYPEIIKVLFHSAVSPPLQNDCI